MGGGVGGGHRLLQQTDISKILHVSLSIRIRACAVDSSRQIKWAEETHSTSSSYDMMHTLPYRLCSQKLSLSRKMESLCDITETIL